MQVKTTVVLVALCVLVGVYFYVVEFNAPVPSPALPGETADTPPLLDAQALAQVKTITLVRDEAPAMFEQLGAGDWSQTQPVVFPAKTAAMEELIAAAASLVPIETLLDDRGQAVPPRATLTLTPEQGQPLVLQLGAKTVAGRGILTVGDSASAYVVDDRLHRAVLDQPYRNWRKTHVQMPQASGCVRLDVKHPRQSITLHKRHGQWFLGHDTHERADAFAVQALTQAMNAMTIKSFIADAPESLTRFGLGDQADVSITCVRAGDAAAPQVLRLGGPADMQNHTYYACWMPTAQALPVIFTVSAEDRSRLLVDADAMRDPRVMTLDPAQMDRVAVHQPGRPDWVLSRTATGFALQGAEDRRVDVAKADRWLALLSDLRAEGFVQASALDLPADPLSAVVIDAQGVSEPMRLRIDAVVKGDDAQTTADADDDELMLSVKRADEAFAYRLPRSALMFLLEPDVLLPVEAPSPGQGDEELQADEAPRLFK